MPICSFFYILSKLIFTSARAGRTGGAARKRYSHTMHTDIAGTVRDVIAAVAARGDTALVSYTRLFDGVTLTAAELKVPARDIAAARGNVAPAVRAAIDESAANIIRFHRQELRLLRRQWRVQRQGVVLGQTMTPVDSVGIYVPGGRFAYPSTVLMTALCARAAGVARIIMVTPPKHVTPAVLYAARVSGVDAVYRVGGAQAVAALALGTRTIPKVDMIVGPGNAFVTEAKRQVYGRVGIDALAGPSEVAIIADAGADPAAVAADCMAQAEHDPLARAYVFTPSSVLASAVRAALDKKYRSHVRITCCSLDAAVARVNALAAEHVEVLVADPDPVARRIRHAGAVFAGYATPTAFGDYVAGPSHVLPTGGAARFSSGLSAATFFKRSSYIRFSAPAAAARAERAAVLADTEGLHHHAASLRIRS